MANWETMNDKTLVLIVNNFKKGMLKVINMGNDAFVGDPEGKKCPPAASFQFNLLMLERAEKEIRRRGFNPSDPRFGPDIMADIVEVQVGLLAG